MQVHMAHFACHRHAVWDAFGLRQAAIRGWWEARPVAATGSASVVATA